jgi:anti-sigma-K factor RskA
MADDFVLATRYLRGELDALQRRAFEERVDEDVLLADALRTAEHLLVDHHLAGAVDGVVRVRIAERLALDGDLRRTLVVIGALFARAGRLPIAPPGGKRWWWITGAGAP